MAYRRTDNAIQGQAEKRARIVKAARDLVADGGWPAAQVDHVAVKGGVATGTVYRYRSSKSELCTEIVAMVSAREVGACGPAPTPTGKGTGARADRHLIEQITQFCLGASVGASEGKP